MILSSAEELAQQLMLEHGLNLWSFAFNSNKRRLGVCRESRKRIELSKHYVLLNDPSHVKDTILHEIAHALVGAAHGHDSVWKDMCRRLGCTPRACDTSAGLPEGMWQAICPGCKKLYSQHRRPSRPRSMYCRPCGPQKGALVFKSAIKDAAKKAEPGGIMQLILKLF